MSILSLIFTKLLTKQGATSVYLRCEEVRQETGLSWSKFAKKAGLPLRSWMTGVPTTNPTDAELQAIATTYGVNFEWLKYGTGDKYASGDPA